MVRRNLIRCVLAVIAGLLCSGASEDGCATNRDVDSVGLADAGDLTQMQDATLPKDGSGVSSDAEPLRDLVTHDAPPDDWWDATYRKRVRIQANLDRAATAMNVPVPLHLSDHAVVDAEPRELRFVGASGKVLEHEVVEWGEQKTVWVLIPTLEARTEFWLYWSNPDALDISDPGAVWADGFEFVGHLENEMPTDALDVTRVAEIFGDPVVTDGIVGRAFDFDGTEDKLDFDDRGETDGVAPDTQYTWEVWFKPRTVERSIFFNNEGWCAGVSIGLFDDGGIEVDFASGGTGEPQDWCSTGYDRAGVEGPPLDLDEWHYAVVRVDRVDDTVSVQLDGVPVGEDTIDADTNGIGHNLTVGGEHAGEFLFDGVIDEARISSVLRSEDWVLFQNVATRDELFEYGAVESL